MKTYVKVKDIAEQYSMSTRQIYKNLELPAFEGTFKKTGEKSIRIDVDAYAEVLDKYYN